jgi:NOL1/NOP2/fmu family ribosome biogenesis protein
MQFGKAATRNIIDLEPEQVQAFMNREDFGITAVQSTHSTGTGYIILRYHGFPLGIGVHRPAQGIVESLYPKGWARKTVVV